MQAELELEGAEAERLLQQWQFSQEEQHIEGLSASLQASAPPAAAPAGSSAAGMAGKESACAGSSMTGDAQAAVALQAAPADEAGTRVCESSAGAGVEGEAGVGADQQGEQQQQQGECEEERPQQLADEGVSEQQQEVEEEGGRRGD